MNRDEIQIRRLKVSTHIGVPDDERAEAQNLWISIRMHPSQDFSGLSDDVSNTVDYHRVSIELAEIASAKPRHLIETMATEVAEHLLTTYPLSCVEVEIEKRILPDADFVAVRIRRQRI
jgi:dihydroneopterin aldolase